MPISSTAHIIIAELLLGYNFPGLAFEIFLHIASIFAVIIFFRRDLWLIIIGFLSYFRIKNSENKAYFLFGSYIIIATFITGVLGLFFKGLVEETMKTPAFIAGGLTVTGTALVFVGKFWKHGNRTYKNMTIWDAVKVGIGQAVAVLPGISRSGSTLATALWIGLDRDTAVRYSFLLAIPVILGSTVLTVGEIPSKIWSIIGTGPLIMSFFTSFSFSWIGIIWLINFLKQGRLLYFAFYCYVIALIVFIFVREIPTTF